jgi:hypothetical protein
MFKTLRTLLRSPVDSPCPDTAASGAAGPPPLPRGWLPENMGYDFPPRFAELKARILPHGQHVLDAWNEILVELADTTEKFNATLQEVGSWYLD